MIIAAAYGRFNCICQVATVCTPTYASLGPPESISETASRLVQPLLHSPSQSVPIGLLYSGPPLPLKISHSYGGSGPHLIIHGSFGPAKFITQTPSRSVEPFLPAKTSARKLPVTSVTDRPTDHSTRSVTIGRDAASKKLSCWDASKRDSHPFLCG